MRLPMMSGVAYPRPTSTFQRGVSAAGHVAGAANAVTVPSRFGPRHWVQSPDEGADPV
jgi:hypothetical protein